MISVSLGRVLEVIAAWIIFAVALAFLIGPVIAKGMRRNKARDDRWLAESDADFAEHADEALSLFQPESLDDYLARHRATWDELVFAGDVMADIDELPEVAS